MSAPDDDDPAAASDVILLETKKDPELPPAAKPVSTTLLGFGVAPATPESGEPATPAATNAPSVPAEPSARIDPIEPARIEPAAIEPARAEPAPEPRERAAPVAEPVARADEPSAPLAKPRRRWLRIIARVAEAGFIAFAFGLLLLWCSVPSTSALAYENPASTAFIDLRREQAEDEGRRFELKWQWRPITKISRYLRAAIIYAEDYNFFRHDGIDWGAVEDALEANLEHGSLAVGGSTITQQLAKNLYLSPSRSMLRKLREMLIAFALEDHLSKQRILELYLNVVEWGDGVFGAEAAARHWFGHSAQALTPAEAARLAIALPNPITRAPNVRTPELTKKAVRIIHLLRMQGLIDEPQERAALDQVGASYEKTIPSRPRPPEPVHPGQPVTQPVPDGQPPVPDEQPDASTVETPPSEPPQPPTNTEPPPGPEP